MILSSIQTLERKYSDKIIMGSHASLMTTRGLDDFEIYDWFPYFQRFTSNFLKNIFEQKDMAESRTILDPFMGSGNTLLACLENGKIGYGVDISPLFWFISHVKVTEYSQADFKKAITSVKNKELKNDDIEIPALSSFSNLFKKKQLVELLALREVAYSLGHGPQELLLFSLVSKLLDFACAKRYGKGLHKKPRKWQPLNVKEVIIRKLNRMQRSLHVFSKKVDGNKKSAMPLLGDARKLDQVVDPLKNKYYELPLGEIDFVLTSPPYCNSSDYVEMYKLEHWFLKFITCYKEFRELSYSTIRSHTTISNKEIKWSHQAIDDICSYLEKENLWNLRLPLMIRGYFDDLYESLRQIRDSLHSRGTALIVIGNSCYAGIPVPSDLIISEMAEELNFEVKRIVIARNLLTSGQQWKILSPESKSLLRESMVVLEANT